MVFAPKFVDHLVFAGWNPLSTCLKSTKESLVAARCTGSGTMRCPYITSLVCLLPYPMLLDVQLHIVVWEGSSKAFQNLYWAQTWLLDSGRIANDEPQPWEYRANLSAEPRNSSHDSPSTAFQLRIQLLSEQRKLSKQVRRTWNRLGPF